MRAMKFRVRCDGSSLAFASRLGILLTLAFALVGAALGQTQGQEKEEAKDGWGYTYAGLGGAWEPGCGSAGVMHFGGGGEAALLGGFGPVVEIGYLSGFSGGGIGAFSPGAFFAFNRNRDTVPFATGGYTLFFRSGLAHGVYFGGGINHWIGDNWGIRIEGRDHLLVEDELHILEARFGFVFR